MSENNAEYAIKVDNVSMHFNMASEKIENLKEYAIKFMKRQLFFKDFVALQNISFEVKPGEVFGIVGTNGSGKSTLLKIISGILEPTSGSIKTNGRISPLIELGAGFDGNLTARENIFLNGAVLGYSKAFIEEKFQSIVDFAELWDFLDMPIKNYSSGMVARIAFAIATVVKPDILIVDEILSVGDFLFQQKCEQRIRDLMANGTTVLIVSHSIDQIRQLCHRVLWIEKGKQMRLGFTQEVCDAYGNLKSREAINQAQELQIVAEETCRLCGQKTQFRSEKGMTCHTEAYCSNCSTQLRSSDLAACLLEEIMRQPEGCLGNNREYFEHQQILCCSQHSVVTAFLQPFSGFHWLDGTLQQWCDQLESVKSIDIPPESLDLILIENMLDLVTDPLQVCRDLADLLKPGGSILITVPVYESRTTVSTKSARHRLYRDGVMIRTFFGTDAADYLNESALRMKMKEYHRWYAPDEQNDPDLDYERMIRSHPFYFYKFNSWVIIGTKEKENLEESSVGSA